MSSSGLTRGSLYEILEFSSLMGEAKQSLGILNLSLGILDFLGNSRIPLNFCREF